METTRRLVRYLRFDEIVSINRRMVKLYEDSAENGGKLLNPNSLHYLVEFVQDTDLCPTLAEKATTYAVNIITRHVFVTANKRTGTFCTCYFLWLNEHSLSESVSNADIERFGLGIADKTIDLTRAVAWLQERTVERRELRSLDPFRFWTIGL